MKVKAKTLEERMGFVDPDRKNPNHDEICFWVENYFRGLVVDEKKAEKEARAHYKKTKKFKEFIIGVDVTYEVPVMTGTKFIVGYLDMVVTKKILILQENQGEYTASRMWGTDEKFFKKWGFIERRLGGSMRYQSFKSELTTPAATKKFLAECAKEGHKEIEYYPPYVGVKYYNESLAIEVKVNIDSFGDLLRQLNTYKAHRGFARCTVVSPDKRFENQLKSQGYGFIKYP